MKYKRLTKEQLESMHEEFAHFLASQQIDAKEWEFIKENKPEMLEEELDVFSDVVWEEVLNKTKYLEHFSKQHINVFKCEETEILRIVVNINRPNFDFFNEKDYRWFVDNSNDPAVQFFKGKKKYDKTRNLELFDLIQKGGLIANKTLFEKLQLLISS